MSGMSHLTTSSVSTPLPTNEVADLAQQSEPSDEDELDDDLESPRGIEKKGTLSKWTNFFHGWQDRFVVLTNGTLSYYKSEFDTAFGCRGSMSLALARIQPHEFDNLRFDVNVNDCVYYLRCNAADERQGWVEALEQSKAARSADQGYSSDVTSLSSMQKATSLVSINSAISGASTSSKAQSHRLKEKLLEMETFRDILYRQVDTLQSFFEECSEQSNRSANISDIDAKQELQQLMERGVDFRGEAMTFKATMAGILATLNHCNELISRKEDRLQKRLEKEVERRKKAEIAARQAASESRRRLFAGGPDYEEGPYSTLQEGDFLDAIEGECERLERQDAYSEKPDHTESDDERITDEMCADNPFQNEIEEKLQENLKYCYEQVGHSWSVVHDDGDMKVYRRDLEEGGVVLDPLKAYHTVKGVTAYEFCQHFFDEKFRMDWEGTLDSFNVLDRFGSNTTVLHQVHKRVWPSSQRDVVFVSHMRDLPQLDTGKEYGRGYVVCNFSIDHEKAPNNGKYIRARCNIALLAHTLLEPSVDGEVTRGQLSCQITYSANVNPGGWAPPSVVRAVSKREYPKFLRKFSQFVLRTTHNQPIRISSDSHIHKPEEQLESQ